ncbi:helix-turn-helix domain-containing protein [Natronobacterium texcoconense]|uniref:Predicted DNA binding protein, contains HTH domain n=1 Tax=Natronobacterium texcoconense TaxID=1095778 RepID=A0A1H1AXV4_NATTX|nr:helix-turn-helix domain-containing protein [Natronobacterium texcoconense]SDQ44499.1 Predicted DNA binding protein, contains HTH domain [Natronobacterium texcoconense]
MISLALSVRQCDCPLTEASDEYDVAFVTPHWHYDHDRGDLELRILADAADGSALECGLDVVRSHEETIEFELLAKHGRTGRARLTMGTTDVMRTIVDHDGYLTGPFENVDGSERWQVGFDSDAAAEAALAILERRDDDVELRNRRVLDPETVLEDVHADAIGSTVLERSRELTATERETLRLAIDTGYYDVPRSATLGDLADALEVSDAAVSKTLRRAEGKLLEPTVSAVESVLRREPT